MFLGPYSERSTRARIALTARQANKCFCFSLIFPELKMPAWKNNTTKHCHAIDLTSEGQPWGVTAQEKQQPTAHPHAMPPRAHRPSIAHLTQHPLASPASLLYHLTHIPQYWVACRDKNKTTAASFCYVGPVSLPPQSFSVIGIELICTTTFQGNLEGTAGF